MTPFVIANGSISVTPFDRDMPRLSFASLEFPDVQRPYGPEEEHAEAFTAALRNRRAILVSETELDVSAAALFEDTSFVVHAETVGGFVELHPRDPATIEGKRVEFVVEDSDLAVAWRPRI